MPITCGFATRAVKAIHRAKAGNGKIDARKVAGYFEAAWVKNPASNARELRVLAAARRA